MNIKIIIGFFLESCRFSKSSYTFEFSGRLNGVMRRFLVSTPYYFSTSTASFKNDSCDNFSREIWSMLEEQLEDIVIDDRDEGSMAIFKFSGDKSFLIWSDGPLVDNLILVTSPDDGSWFAT